MNHAKTQAFALALLLALLVAGCTQPQNPAPPVQEPGPQPPAPEVPQTPPVNQVVAQRQLVVDNQVSVWSATLDKPGFVVVHLVTDTGTPGTVVGHSTLFNGTRTDFNVLANGLDGASGIYLMLHYDNGDGAYTSLDEDKPVQDDQNQPIMIKIALNNTHRVQIDGFKFIPARLTVQAGDEVVFENKDPTNHSITIQDLGIDALVPAQQNASVILRTAGDYDYFCGFHPTMKGEISVTP